jgi:peptidoglycan/xylan/chitin deacetylase (PgdA/CDA1 family)
VVLGKPAWMSNRDIKRLVYAGMTIGSHTWNHYAVSLPSSLERRSSSNSPAQMQTPSEQLVEHFAYPYGD